MHIVNHWIRSKSEFMRERSAYCQPLDPIKIKIHARAIWTILTGHVHLIRLEQFSRAFFAFLYRTRSEKEIEYEFFPFIFKILKYIFCNFFYKIWKQLLYWYMFVVARVFCYFQTNNPFPTYFLNLFVWLF